MDTPSESSISWGPIISSALARTVLVLGFGSAPNSDEFLNSHSHFSWALNFIRKTIIKPAALVYTGSKAYKQHYIVLSIIYGCF